jgi:hypothetical protein
MCSCLGGGLAGRPGGGFHFSQRGERGRARRAVVLAAPFHVCSYLGGGLAGRPGGGPWPWGTAFPVAAVVGLGTPPRGLTAPAPPAFALLPHNP